MPVDDPSTEPEDLGTYFQAAPRAEETPPETPPLPPSGPASDSAPGGLFGVEAGSQPTLAAGPSMPSPFPSAPSGRTPGGPHASLSVPEEIVPGLTLFGKYRTIRRLGRGGMGEVWLVENLTFAHERALKLILPGRAFGSEARARFRREAQLMARATHPNFVQVHAAEIDESTAYIEMEYLRGESLDRLVRRGEPAPPAWVLGVLAPLGRVLDAIHHRPERIVHRDLKPSNLMLLDQRSHDPGALKLLDLGIAKSLVAAEEEAAEAFQTGSGVMLFTAQYASPEQINHAMAGDEAGAGVDIDHRADIYALGVMLYQFLTGYLPFEGPIQSLLLKHLNEPPPPFARRNPAAKVPEAIERIVLRCLEKDRGKRPNSAAEVCREFDRALAADTGSGPLARTQADYPDLWPSRPGPGDYATVGGPAFAPEGPRRRRPARLLVAGLAVAGCAALGAAGYVVTRPRPTTVGTPDKPPPTPPRPPVSPVEPTPANPLPPRLVDLGFEPAAGSRLGERGLPETIILHKGPHPIEFRLIPGGEFTLGHPPVDDDPRFEDCLPPRVVKLSPFYMQSFETSNAELATFLKRPEAAAMDKEHRRIAEPLGDALKPLLKKPRYPAFGVTVELAEAYAAWLGGKLPTEAQFEYAARSGGKPVDYPWQRGEPPAEGYVVKDHAVVEDEGELDFDDNDPDGTRAARGVSEQGVYHLIGNLREWCRDPTVPADSPYYKLAPGTPPPLDPVAPPHLAAPGPAPRVIRGGSWMSAKSRVSAFGPRSERDDDRVSKQQLETYKTSRDLGFRVVLEPGPLP